MNCCNDCGHTFDQPQFVRENERIDYGIGSRWVTLWEGHVCPNCESSDFAEVPDEEEA